MRDKDVYEILAPLLPLTSRVIATSAPTPRALPADELAARVRTAAERLGPLGESLRGSGRRTPSRRRSCSRVGPLACVAGSIFLVGPCGSASWRAPPCPPAAGMTTAHRRRLRLAVVLAAAAANGQQLQPPAAQQTGRTAPGGAPPAARSLRSRAASRRDREHATREAARRTVR
jgi:hypothetical protein